MLFKSNRPFEDLLSGPWTHPRSTPAHLFFFGISSCLKDKFHLVEPYETLKNLIRPYKVLPDYETDFGSLVVWRHSCLAKLRRRGQP